MLHVLKTTETILPTLVSLREAPSLQSFSPPRALARFPLEGLIELSNLTRHNRLGWPEPGKTVPIVGIQTQTLEGGHRTVLMRDARTVSIHAPDWLIVDQYLSTDGRPEAIRLAYASKNVPDSEIAFLGMPFDAMLQKVMDPKEDMREVYAATIPFDRRTGVRLLGMFTSAVAHVIAGPIRP